MAGDARTAWRMAFAFAAMAAVSAASLLLPEGSNPVASEPVEQSTTTQKATTTTERATTTTAAPIGIVGPNAGASSIYDISVNIPTAGCWSLTTSSAGFTTAEVVACEVAHQFETFTRDELPASVIDYADVPMASEALCEAAFERFVGIAEPPSRFTFGWATVLEQTWPNDRAVTCFLHLPTEYLYTGSAEGVAQ